MAGRPAERPLVRAAGGVVWRRESQSVQIVLVHRPRYDDWTLPKGKVDAGETYEEAALREVREEASVLAEIGPELPSTTYLDRSGKHKHVRYWAMSVVEGSPAGDNEVDVAEWVDLSEARSRLTYERDVSVVDALAGVLDEESAEGS